MRFIDFYNVWLSVFEGGGADDSGGGGADNSGGGGADNSGGGGASSKTFTQEQVNQMLASERRKHQSSAQKAIEELEALKTKAQMTQQERDELDQRIQQLTETIMTKDELAKQQQEKLKKEAENKVKTLEDEVKNWRGMYTESTIARSITDAAVEHGAFHPEQIQAILGPMTRLVEVLDADGKPIPHKYTPKVKYNDIDKTTGKPVTLDLSPTEAVKRMSETDKYLNLFKASGSGGYGGSNTGGGKQPDIATLAKDPEAYIKARREGKIKF